MKCLPEPGEYYELINSDAERYGGSGLENLQPMPSGPVFWQACPHSIILTLPPLSMVALKRRAATQAEEVVERELL
jgi:1,4-alpha-glucan branching enzyme